MSTYGACFKVLMFQGGKGTKKNASVQILC